MKRLAIGKAINKHGLSERHACRLVGLSRDSYRHPPQATPENAQISAAIIDLAQARRRFGYRRIHDMLRPVFPGINHKRIYRLYSNANLAVRERKKAKRPMSERVPYQIAQRVNEVRSMASRGSTLRAFWIGLHCSGTRA